MNKRDVNWLSPSSPQYVIEHARWKASRGRKPSASFNGERNPRKALEAAKELLKTWQIKAPSSAPCQDDIYKNGTCLFVTHSISSDSIEAWVKQVAKKSGQPVDWHFAGGRARILALGDLDKVKQAICDLIDNHDYRFKQALADDGLFDNPCPRPDWWKTWSLKRRSAIFLHHKLLCING